MDQASATYRLGEAFCRAFTRAATGAPGDPGKATGPGTSPGEGRLTAAQFDCLRFVATHPRCLVKDVAHGLRVSHPAATRLIDRSVARRVLTRQRRVRDRREVRLALTPVGEQALAFARKTRQAALAGILERMSLEDRQSLHAGLRAYLQAALQTPADVDAICGQCGTEHTPDCPLHDILENLKRGN